MLRSDESKILIVEDDPATAAIHRRCLERRGLAVVTAQTAEEALHIVRAGEVKLVVLDYRLADGTTGLDLCKLLKEEGQAPPVVLVTGFSQEATAIEALRAGVRDFVTKSPDYLDYLPEAIERVLQQVGTERQLAESETRLAAIIRSSQDAVMATDEEQRITLFNPAAEEIFHCPAEQALGGLLARFIPDAVSAHWAGAFRSEQSGRRMDGTTVPLEVTMSSATADGKHFSTWVVRDLTRRKRAEAALHQRDEQLRNAQKMEAIGALAGGMAHEFNNLLQAIQGFASFAMVGLAENDPRLTDLTQLMTTVDRATSLTRRLLGFGRRQAVEMSEVAPNQLVADLVKMLRPLISEQIAFEVLPGDNVGTVYADAGQLQQLLLNLCINARDAMPNGGRLSLATRSQVIGPSLAADSGELPPGRYLILTVGDTGCGMAPEVQRHIFEPFFTTKELGQGTGLGLAVVYGIVQQHQGFVRVASRSGQGTTFAIYLPATPAQNFLDPPTDVQRPPPLLNTVRDALAEDAVSLLM